MLRKLSRPEIPRVSSRGSVVLPRTARVAPPSSPVLGVLEGALAALLLAAVAGDALAQRLLAAAAASAGAAAAPLAAPAPATPAAKASSPPRTVPSPPSSVEPAALLQRLQGSVGVELPRETTTLPVGPQLRNPFARLLLARRFLFSALCRDFL